jgi:hypothetical protein
MSQSSNCKNEQRAITQKLRFFCTALLFNEINLPTKFHVDTSLMVSELCPGKSSKCKN